MTEERDWARGKGTRAFLELGDFGDCRDFKVIVGGVIGDIPGSVKDSAVGNSGCA